MTREEFLHALEQHLSCLQPEERQNAMAYYQEYLEEAGSEHEAEALEHLGSPESVAKRIIAETGTAELPRGSAVPQYHFPTMGEMPAKNAESPTSAGRIVLTVVVLVLTSPIWLTVWSLWLALVVSLGAILVSFCAVAVAAPIQAVLEFCRGMAVYGLYDLGCGLLFIGLVMLLQRPIHFLIRQSTVLLKKGFLLCVNSLLGKGDKA